MEYILIRTDAVRTPKVGLKRLLETNCPASDTSSFKRLTDKMCFWRFHPTEREPTFFVRRTHGFDEEQMIRCCSYGMINSTVAELRSVRIIIAVTTFTRCR